MRTTTSFMAQALLLAGHWTWQGRRSHFAGESPDSSFYSPGGRFIPPTDDGMSHGMNLALGPEKTGEASRTQPARGLFVEAKETEL